MGFPGKNELSNAYRKDTKSDAACAVSDLGLDNLLFLLLWFTRCTFFFS